MDNYKNEYNQGNRWLLNYKKDVYSQYGEDGIIEEIFKLMPDLDQWCVEFGANDGINCSNTHNLILNKNYSAVKIEASKKIFRKLKINYYNQKNVYLINKFVTFDGNNKLDIILSETPISENFDLLSIDIDGNDFHIWDSLNNYRPKVVIIEFNPTIPNHVLFCNPKNMKVTQGSSLATINELAKRKRYELIAVTEANAIYVDEKYFHLFGIENNSPDELRDIHKYESTFFQLFDGTIVLQGCDYLIWNSIKIKNRSLQQTPKIFRKYPGNLNPVLKFLLKVYRIVRKRI